MDDNKQYSILQENFLKLLDRNNLTVLKVKNLYDTCKNLNLIDKNNDD